MKSRLRFGFYALLLAAAVTYGAGAALAAPRTAAPRPVSIGLVTGPETGTYHAFGRDIAEVSRSMGQPVELRPTSGSIENIKLMTQGGENAGLGIVQSDVLGFLKRSSNPNSQQVAQSLRMVFPFYQEEVHVLARNGIASVKDLAGKRVVIGAEGSGNSLTAINLFSLLQIEPSQMLQLAPAEGIVAVLANEADAMVFVGGKPVPLFDNLADLKSAQGGRNAELLEEIHFLPLDDPRVLTEYERAEITPQDYPFVKDTVPTVSVTSVLVAYDFSSGRNPYYVQRCNELQKVGSAIRRNLTYLKSSGHPKWQQVDLNRELNLWKRDMCSWREDAPAVATPKPAKPRFTGALERDLLNVIRHGDPAKPAAAPAKPGE